MATRATRLHTTGAAPSASVPRAAAGSGRVQSVSLTEARVIYEERVQALLHISAAEFEARWEQGEYSGAPEHEDAVFLHMMRPEPSP